MTLREFVVMIGFKADEASFNRLENRLNTFASKLGVFGRQLTMFVSAPLAAIAAYALKAASDIEQTHMAFEVYLNDAKKAKAVMADLISFAVKTPFRFTGVQKAANMLLATGTAAKDLIGTLRILGNVSRGKQELLNRVVVAYYQVMQAKKLRGQELRQFTEAGVGLVDELAKLTGHSAMRIASEPGRLNISSETVHQALKNMTSEGGKYFRLLEKQATTLGGIFSNLMDSLYFFAAKGGQQLVKLFNLKKLLQGFIDTLNKLLNVFDELSEVQKILLIIVPLLVGAIGPLAIGFSLLIRSGLFVISTFKLMSTAILGVNAGLGALMVKALLLPGIIAAAIGSIYLIIDDFLVWMKGGDSFFGDAFGPFALTGMPAFLSKLTAFKDFIINTLIGGIAKAIRGLVKLIRALVSGDAYSLSVLITNAVNTFWTILKKVFNWLWLNIGKLKDMLINLLPGLLAKMAMVVYDLVTTLMAGLMLAVANGLNKLIAETQAIPILKKALQLGVSAAGTALTGPLAGSVLKGSILSGNIAKHFKNNNNGTSPGVNVQNNFDMTVPAGTSEDQQAYLEEKIRDIANTEFTKAITDVLVANPGY